jgi:CubicO group peptidase (beta-lactamase class C family)
MKNPVPLTTAQRLIVLDPILEDILQISGTPGLSIGISYGSVQSYKGFGYRDVDNQLPPDEDTIYTLASLTKAIMAAMIGILVDQKKLEWNTRLRDILPDFCRADNDPRNDVTITDLLSHRIGLPGYDNLWFLGNNRIVMKKEDAIPIFNYLPGIKDFRDSFVYNNFAYEILGRIIEKVTESSLQECLEKYITKPLGLKRTYFGAKKGEENVAKAYMTLLDGTAAKIPPPLTDPKGFNQSAGGLHSCISDLLSLYGAYMEAGAQEMGIHSGHVRFANNPFHQVGYIWQSKTNSPVHSLLEWSYSCGWGRMQTPGPFALPGYKDISKVPFVGKKSASRLVLLHSGAIAGSMTFTAILPEEPQIAVVILTNGCSLDYDVPRLVAEMIVEALITDQYLTNLGSYVDRCRSAVAERETLMKKIVEDIKKNKTQHKATRSLKEYEGRYYNESKAFFLEIAQQEDQLLMKFAGLDDDCFVLQPYQEDSFTWFTDHDDLAKRGRTNDVDLDYYILNFLVGNGGKLEISWKFEMFVKTPERLKQLDC